MKVQAAQICFYLLVVWIVGDGSLEPGGEAGNFFSPPWWSDYCLTGREFFQRGGDKIWEAGAIFKAVLESSEAGWNFGGGGGAGK